MFLEQVLIEFPCVDEPNESLPHLLRELNVCLALNGLYVFVLISVEQMFLKRGLNENQEILKNIFQLFATAGTKVTVQDVRISKGYREKVVIVIFTLLDINTFFMVIIIAML